MSTYKDFCEELGSVPELPPGLFGKIDGRIRRRNVYVRTAFALAATVIIAVGATGVLVAQRGKDQTCPPRSPQNCNPLKAISRATIWSW